MAEFEMAEAAPPLTPAAQRLLDDVTDELRAGIVRRARGRASLFEGVPNEVGLRDVIAALDDIDMSTALRPSKRSVPFEALLLIALLAAGSTILMVVAFTQASPNRSEPFLSASAALVGALTTAATSLFLIRVRQLRHEGRQPSLHRAEETARRVLVRWIELEKTMRSRVADARGEAESAAPLWQLINSYADVYKLPQSDIRRLQELVRLRNEIVSGEVIEDRERLHRALRDMRRYAEDIPSGS
jgi:hypothetical protein